MELTPMNEDLTAQEEAVQEHTEEEITPAERPVEMVTVCDIQFRNNSKIYYFAPGELEVKAGTDVVIETSRGLEYGQCVRGNHVLPLHETVSPLRKVVRIATEQDTATDTYNREREKKAFQICMKKIEELKLDMQLVSAECAFDGSKILFFFTAEERVDFRELVKQLGYALHSRIELRQIGVRDKAKMVGGLGICGRPFCCGQFLKDFQPVSIKMAKTQNLSLNPTKISGTCGRLMCCLNYEQLAYEDLHRTSPKAESFVDTPDGRGTITDVNLLKQTVRVRLEKQPDTIVCHKNCDICVLRSGKAKKTDEPIPEDLAPISGKKQNQPAEKPAFSAYLDPDYQAKGKYPPATDAEDKDKASRRRTKGGKPQKTAEVAPKEKRDKESTIAPKEAKQTEIKAVGKDGKQSDPKLAAREAKQQEPKTATENKKEPVLEAETAPKPHKKPGYKQYRKDYKHKKYAQDHEGGEKPPVRKDGSELSPVVRDGAKKDAAPAEGTAPAQRPRPHYHHRYYKHRKPNNKSEG